MFLSFSSVWPLQNDDAQILCFCCPSFSGLVPDRVVLLSLVFSMQIIYFSAYRFFWISTRSCCFVVPRFFYANIILFCISIMCIICINQLFRAYHVYHMYDVPYVSYVTNVFLYSHICPKNVTNYFVSSMCIICMMYRMYHM